MSDERAQTYLRLLAERQARSSPRSGPDIARSVEQGFEAAPFRLRLTPPLRARPDRIEVVVTGRAARARVVAPVGTDREMPDT